MKKKCRFSSLFLKTLWNTMDFQIHMKSSSIQPWIENFEETGGLESVSCRTPMMMMIERLNKIMTQTKKTVI